MDTQRLDRFDYQEANKTENNDIRSSSKFRSVFFETDTGLGKWKIIFEFYEGAHMPFRLR